MERFLACQQTPAQVTNHRRGCETDDPNATDNSIGGWRILSRFEIEVDGWPTFRGGITPKRELSFHLRCPMFARFWHEPVLSEAEGWDPARRLELRLISG
jgi:hypothetical protein